MHVSVFVFIFACTLKCVCNIKLYFVSNLLQSVLFYTTSTPLSSDIPVHVYFCIILCHCGHIWKRISKHSNNIHFISYIFLMFFKKDSIKARLTFINVILWHYKWHRHYTLYFLHQVHIYTNSNFLITKRHYVRFFGGVGGGGLVLVFFLCFVLWYQYSIYILYRHYIITDDG